jgi:hypothetical protein
LGRPGAAECIIALSRYTPVLIDRHSCPTTVHSAILSTVDLPARCAGGRGARTRPPRRAAPTPAAAAPSPRAAPHAAAIIARSDGTTRNAHAAGSGQAVKEAICWFRRCSGAVVLYQAVAACYDHVVLRGSYDEAEAHFCQRVDTLLLKGVMPLFVFDGRTQPKRCRLADSGPPPLVCMDVMFPVHVIFADGNILSPSRAFSIVLLPFLPVPNTITYEERKCRHPNQLITQPYDGAHGGATARVAISSVDLRARGPSFLAQARSAKTHQNSGSGCASRCRRQFVHRG